MGISSISRVLDSPVLYSWFHAIFSGDKATYLRQYLESKRSTVLKVLDLGCGPGTNAPLFLDHSKYNYTGVDINPAYISTASRRFALKFICADIATLKTAGEKYDIVLINSVLHHLTDGEVHHVLQAASELTVPGGECAVLDMIHPPHLGLRTALQAVLIRLDRGRFCRSLSTLEALLSRHLKIDDVQPFSIRAGGILLWDLRLFVCHRKSSES